MASQVSGLENEILEPKIKQQSEKEFVAKQSEDQNESDDHKETKKKRLSTIDSTDEHLQPQVPLPSPGTPAPGGSHNSFIHCSSFRTIPPICQV